MVQFVVGDIVHLCASIKDFCGQSSQVYDINDINISKTEGCVLDVPDGCLPFDGIEIIFQWTNILGTTETHMCDPTYNLKSLGSAVTNSEGRASLQYTITEEDQTLFNSNPTFDLRACINNVTNYTFRGGVRSSFGHDNIQIGIPEATHIIRYKLTNNEFLADIQANILDISTKLVSELNFTDIPVQYINSEIDIVNRTFNVHVRYTGTETLYNTSSLSITDNMTAFAERALVFVLTAIIAALIASIILSAGWTGVAIAQALLTGSAILILGYVVYKIVDDSIIKDETIKNLQAFVEITTKKDTTKEELDKAYTNSPKTKNDCLTLLNGYKSTDLTYLDEFYKRLPLLELNVIKSTYITCADNLIQQFNSDTINCDTARADISVCSTAAYSTTDQQFQIKYDSTKPFKGKEDCWIKKPLTEECILSAKTGKIILIGGGLIGLSYLYSKSKKK